MTVGELKKFIDEHNIPDDALVLYQRIEDVYFKEHHWDTVNKESELYWELMYCNKNIDEGVYLDKEEYPLMKPEFLIKHTEEDLENSKNQYIEAWCPVKYKDDNNLYIDAHY